MNKLVKGSGALLFLVGLVPLILAQTGVATNVDMIQYIQMIGAMVVGGGVFGYDKLPKLNITNLEKPVDKLVQPENPNEEAAPEITKLKQLDLEAINHLSERLLAGKDAKGLELCRELQNRVFDLHHKPIAETKNVTA